MTEIGLTNVADGVATELFKHSLQKVSDNIADANTGAKSVRKITLTFEFAPDEDREEVKVTVSAKTSLASIKAYTKTAFTGKRNGKPTLYAGDTKQVDMFDDVTPIKNKADKHA